MGLWHFTDANGKGVAWLDGIDTLSNFDDGLAYLPDEDGFDRTAADAKAKALGKGVTAHLSGVPNWHSRIEREQKEQADAEREKAEKQAEADRSTADKETEARNAEQAEQNRVSCEAQSRERILQLTDPEGYAEAQRVKAARAEYDNLAQFASKAEKAKIAEALGLAL
jgi:hypothetical protein